jgi:hypothetical protein
VKWPTLVLGIIPGVFIALGFAPQYYELYMTRNPDGLSTLFLFIDSLGAIFSIVTLMLHDTFDWVAFAIFFPVVLLDFGLIVWCWALRRRNDIDMEVEVKEVSNNVI